MIILGGKRYCGKTTELIKLSAINDMPIIVLNNQRKMLIKNMAKRMDLKIPEPISYKCIEKLRGNKNKILIDDVEDILRDIFYYNPIAAITTSIPFYPLESIKKWRDDR